MKVVRLQIEQQMAQIQVSSQKARLGIESPHRKMEVNRQPAKMTVDNQLGSVALDSTSLKENTGRCSVFSLQRKYAAESVENAQNWIQKVVQDGDYVAQQPNPGNTWGTLAQEHMLEVDTSDSGRSTVPQSGISMNGNGGHCKINWSPYELGVKWENYQSPNITVEQKPSVEVQLSQKPKITFEAKEEYIPPEIGQNVDING